MVRTSAVTGALVAARKATVPRGERVIGGGP
jgi:hypothetical protein